MAIWEWAQGGGLGTSPTQMCSWRVTGSPKGPPLRGAPPQEAGWSQPAPALVLEALVKHSPYPMWGAWL